MKGQFDGWKIEYGPHTFVNGLDEEVLGVPPKTIVHSDIDGSELSTHEYALWARAGCEWCKGIFE
jgi:hypothetical protein